MGPEINRLQDVIFLLVVAKSGFCIIPYQQLVSSFLIAWDLVNKKQSVFVKHGCFVHCVWRFCEYLQNSWLWQGFVNMEENYSIVEYTDIHLMYGKAKGNALEATRFYAEKHFLG